MLIEIGKAWVEPDHVAAVAIRTDPGGDPLIGQHPSSTVVLLLENGRGVDTGLAPALLAQVAAQINARRSDRPR